MRFADLKPELPATIFPQQLKNREEHYRSISLKTYTEAVRVHNGWKGSKELCPTKRTQTDDFADDELDDQDLIAAGKCLN